MWPAPRPRPRLADSGPPSNASTPSDELGSFGEWLSLVGPGKGLGGGVVALDECEQLRLQVGLAGEEAALEQPSGEDREEEVDLGQPGGGRGGEVEVPAGGRLEPLADLGCLVALEVVEDG